jgi:hypothetical protein
MFDELDEALRQLLMAELPVKNGEVGIDFHQPRREWSARLSRPTLNFFLYDVRENNKLRQAQPQWTLEQTPDGQVLQRRSPVRLDVHYILTAWATEPEDEHRLLGRALAVLLAHPQLPPELLPEALQDQPVPIQYMAAQVGELPNASDLWSAMDNEMRPSVVVVLTVAMNPYKTFKTPLVQERELRFGQAQWPWLRHLDEAAGVDSFWTIGGHVHSEDGVSVKEMALTLVEHGVAIPLNDDGRFTVGPLRAGEYTLSVSVAGHEARRRTITVPAPDYELVV